MNLEQQVTSLELSKILKEYGIKQDTLFYWYKGHSNAYADYHYQGSIYQDYPSDEKLYSAFTASEILEILPNNVDGMTLRIIKDWINEYVVAYQDLFNQIKTIAINDINLCNALAKMLIHLIENKLIEV